MDYKLSLMKILHCFSEMEGTWFERTWVAFGITEVEAAEINKEYLAYSDKLTKEE